MSGLFVLVREDGVIVGGTVGVLEALADKAGPICHTL